MIRFPGQGAVCDGFGEDYCVTCLTGDLADVFLVFLIQAHFLRTGIIAFVRSGYEREAAIACVDIGELDGDDGESVVHFAISEYIILVGVKSGSRGAVEAMAFGAFVHPEQKHLVIDAEAFAEYFVEIGHNAGMRQHVAEGIAPGFVPVNQAAQFAAAMRAFKSW